MKINGGNDKFYETMGWSFHDHRQIVRFKLSDSKPTLQRSVCAYKSALESLRSGGLKVSHCKKSSKKKRAPRQKSAEDEGTVLTKGPITIPETQVETRHPVPVSQNHFHRQPCTSLLHGRKLQTSLERSLRTQVMSLLTQSIRDVH
jgi:hypothetical protein